MSQLLRMVGVVIAVGWGGFLVWNGWDLLGSPDPGSQRGGIEMAAFGGLVLMIALVSFIYHAMKFRAPALQKDRPTEPEEVVMDADAALERYLARKAEQDHAPAAPKAPAKAPMAAAPQPAAPVSQRPVFGRRGTTA